MPSHDAQHGRFGSFGHGSQVLVAMFDNRPLDRDFSSHKYNAWSFAARLNQLFACHHGYEFKYFVTDANTTTGLGQPTVDEWTGTARRPAPFKTAVSCWLNGNVARATSWCKLTGVAVGLALGYTTVVMVDSDAFLRVGGLTLTVEQMVQRHAPPPGQYGALVDSAPIWLANNVPWGREEPNCGLQIWRGGPLLHRSWSALHAWWHADRNPLTHGFEQAGLYAALQRWSDYSVLVELPWMNKSAWTKLPAVHISSGDRGERMRVMGNNQSVEAVIQVSRSIYGASAVSRTI